MVRKPNETVQNFIDRFSGLASTIGIPDEYIGLLIIKLPNKLQEKY